MNQETFIKRLCPQIELKYWRKRDLSIFTKGRRGFIVKIYQLGLLYGDGIGPEVVESAVKILRAASSRVGDTKFNIKELPEIGRASCRKKGYKWSDEGTVYGEKMSVGKK